PRAGRPGSPGPRPGAALRGAARGHASPSPWRSAVQQAGNPARSENSLVDTARIGPRDPGPDAGGDLVGDGAERLAPLLCGGLAFVPWAEQHHLIARCGRLVTEVDHELIHADRTRDRPAAAARADQRQPGRR